MISKAWLWLMEGINQRDDYTRETLIISVVLSIITFYAWVMKKSRQNTTPLPPGPRGLPLVGNLPFLEPDLNRFLADLAKTYGPVFRLQLGSRLCVVLSSPSVAKEVLKDHDTMFANHDPPIVGLTSSYGGINMVWSPYGEHWRMLRKISVTHLLSNKRLDSFYEIRRREGHKMAETIASMTGIPIPIHDYVNATLFEILSGMLWGGSLVGENKQLSSEFRKYSQNLVDLCGEPNISDVFPFLAVFDLQRKMQRMKKLMVWFDKMFDEAIEQGLKMMGDEKILDFLQLLLQCKDQVDQKTSPLTNSHIKALLMDMIVAGTKTSSTTIEWALAELMQRPHLIKKAQEELEQVVGVKSMVEDSHLPQLPYINAIVKEALRLHPAAPLLIPRISNESCVVGGYLIPKGAKILINAWAIQRDPQNWENPLEFRPERFMNANGNGDLNGTNFSYIPFGSGRRVCVGIPLAERMIPYLLATLLHSFNWKLKEGDDLDMSEAFGLELVKKIPLVLIPTERWSFV